MRLVIAEGSAILRAGLSHVLDAQGHQLVAAVHDARVLPVLAARHRPDVLICNVRLAPSWSDEGVSTALTVRERTPGTSVLLFSATAEPEHVARLFAGDSAGLAYLLHDRMTDCDHLMDTLTRIAAGGTVLDPRMVRALATGTAAPGPGTRHGRRTGGLGILSEREREVLDLMAQGRTNNAIAEQLVVSPGTVEKRVASVFDKLGIPSGPDDNRRVLSVLRYLEDREPPAALTGTAATAPRRRHLSSVA